MKKFAAGFCLGWVACYAVGFVLPEAHADPAYCYTSGTWIPFPDTQGQWCPDGEAPFNGPGPSYGGGNHRWPDGSDG